MDPTRSYPPATGKQRRAKQNDDPKVQRDAPAAAATTTTINSASKPERKQRDRSKIGEGIANTTAGVHINPGQNKANVTHRSRRARWEREEEEDDDEQYSSDEIASEDERPEAVRVGDIVGDDLESGQGLKSLVSTDGERETNDPSRQTLQQPLVEAKLVQSDSTVTKDERQQIEQETQERIYGELGEVAEATVVDDANPNPKKWPLPIYIYGVPCFF